MRAGACYQEKVYGSIDTRILDDGRLMSSATKVLEDLSLKHFDKKVSHGSRVLMLQVL